MTQHYMAAEEVAFLHPDDCPPPRGTKVLLYMYPHGVTILGEFHKSGASLWAPMPKVSREMKDRLAKEQGR